jgi:hypothetical protein
MTDLVVAGASSQMTLANVSSEASSGADLCGKERRTYSVNAHRIAGCVNVDDVVEKLHNNG